MGGSGFQDNSKADPRPLMLQGSEELSDRRPVQILSYDEPRDTSEKSGMAGNKIADISNTPPTPSPLMVGLQSQTQSLR